MPLEPTACSYSTLFAGVQKQSVLRLNPDLDWDPSIIMQNAKLPDTNAAIQERVAARTYRCFGLDQIHEKQSRVA